MKMLICTPSWSSITINSPTISALINGGLILLTTCLCMHVNVIECVSHDDSQQTTVIRKYPFSPNCTAADRKAIIQCEDDARRVWHVDDVSYYTSTRSFCCFVWDTLSCALEIAQRCDAVYAAELTEVTEQTLETLCDYTAGSSSCTFPAWAWWPVVPIIIGCLTICVLVLYLAYPKQRQRLNTRDPEYDYELAERK